jgi:hypothetical protein
VLLLFVEPNTCDVKSNNTPPINKLVREGGRTETGLGIKTFFALSVFTKPGTDVVVHQD